MHKNEQIASLGYRLESTDDVLMVRPLLELADLTPVEDPPDGARSEYVIATTPAGGIAACAGWTRLDDSVVLHSLAVAPPSRGSGVGVSLLAEALARLMESRPVEVVYLKTTTARRFFASYGFVEIDDEDIPTEVADHPTFESSVHDATPMARRYKHVQRGLDQCAFRLETNQTPNAVMPSGAVIFFQQAGQVLEAHYRGGPIRRGHILGRVHSDEVSYVWHAYSSSEDLMHGDGVMTITSLDDGRRELSEWQGDELMLSMREV